MDPEAEALTRRAAERLAAQLGADLPADVEAALQGSAAGAPQRYEAATLIALAALVLNIVQIRLGSAQGPASGCSAVAVPGGDCTAGPARSGASHW